MFSSKKPKFKLDFTLKELSNIPHTNGYCYVEFSIQDAHLGIRAAISQWKPVLKGEDISKDAGSSSSSSTHLHVRTTKRKIHNFKCLFNYNFSCNLRFPYKKRDNMIGDKYLMLRVFYIGEKSSKTDARAELGRVELNLAEYLNFKEPVTAKYLLQDSKVNSILSFTLGLNELPSDFQFRTQLQIDDSTHNTSTGTNASILTGQNTSEPHFNVPQFTKKAVLGGLDGMLPNGNSESSRQGSSDEELKVQSSKKDTKGNENHKSDEASQPINSRRTYDNILMDPVVSGLYRNVLESAWDPEMRELLKYPPEKVVEHIFSCGDSDDWRDDLPVYKDFRQLLKNDPSKERDSSGLVGEESRREDLKSWTISWAQV